MKQTHIIMGMPITLTIDDARAQASDLEQIFAYFRAVDETFSTYKETSEISAINRGNIAPDAASSAMQEILRLAAETRDQTGGYFDITTPDGRLDPSGIVKGWAIQNAAQQLTARGFQDFLINAGGDIQASCTSGERQHWTIGIRNPFNAKQIVQTLRITNEGVATSGSYMRGNHIYNPRAKSKELNEIVSLSVIGPNIYEADRFATAGFAMGREGAAFIAHLDGFAGYQIDRDGIALKTPRWAEYCVLQTTHH